MLLMGAGLLLALQASHNAPQVLPWGRPAVMRALQVLEEPPLAVREPLRKAARLVLVPPWPNRRIVLIRVSLQTSAVEVVTKTLMDWFPGRGSATVFPVRTLPVSKWGKVEEALKTGLWGYYPQPFPDRTIADGSVWYLEANGPRGYVEVVQHSPRTGAFREACHALIWLSGLDMTQDEFIQWFTS
jgi:hypothetical protein